MTGFVSTALLAGKGAAHMNNTIVNFKPLQFTMHLNNTDIKQHTIKTDET